MTEFVTTRHALALLGLSLDDITADSVREAFAAAVKRAHPDMGGAGDLGLLKQAREKLLALAAVREGVAEMAECPVCRGDGTVRASRSAVRSPCPMCSGQGEVAKRKEQTK